MRSIKVQAAQHYRRAILQVLLLAGLVLLTLSDAINLLLFHWLNSQSQQLPHWLLLGITDLGHGATLGSLMLCYLIRRPELMPRILVASLLSLIIVPWLKQYFDAPRPAEILETLNIVGEQRLHHSFPSGHSASAFLFAGTLLFLNDTARWGTTALLVASMVAISRVMVGAHWPADVLAGALVGLTCAYLAAKVPLIPLATRTGLLIVLSLLVTLIVCQLEDMNKPLIWQITSLRWILILLASYQLIRAALCHMKQHNNSQHLPTESQRLTERVGSG